MQRCCESGIRISSWSHQINKTDPILSVAVGRSKARAGATPARSRAFGCRGDAAAGQRRCGDGQRCAVNIRNCIFMSLRCNGVRKYESKNATKKRLGEQQHARQARDDHYGCPAKQRGLCWARASRSAQASQLGRSDRRFLRYILVPVCCPFQPRHQVTRADLPVRRSRTVRPELRVASAAMGESSFVALSDIAKQVK
ncbi:hypothetical protein R75461_07472 [Paraburkholderia nemoris]|nr:hypothetical protein R75461_07472 [Paraburkholderia nemoris]